MEEIFELIKAFNRLKEKIVELIGKIDLLLKTAVGPQPEGDTKYCGDAKYCVSTDGYVEEEGACRILHLSPRYLAKLRAEKSIPFIKKGRKIQYLVSDLQSYFEEIKTKKQM